VLFATQASFVAAGRIELRRRIGPFSTVPNVAMVALGKLGALIAARRAAGFVGVPIPLLQFRAIPIFDMVPFPTFVGHAADCIPSR